MILRFKISGNTLENALVSSIKDAWMASVLKKLAKILDLKPQTHQTHLGCVTVYIFFHFRCDGQVSQYFCPSMTGCVL